MPKSVSRSLKPSIIFDHYGDGEAMHALARELFPICRSLTGGGVRQTLRILEDQMPCALAIHEVPSGTPAFDWIVPPEWNIRNAFVLDPDGNKIIDFQNNNLHVVSYSEPIDAKLSLSDLQEHLFSLPEQPDAIPYITSYYQRRWGFCLSHRQRLSLKEGIYRAVIDSRIAPGSLTYGELLIPGDNSQEVLLSTYVCHPSMANNELSGPVVATHLAQWIASLPRRRFSYRFVFIPETIGSIVYISRNLERLKTNVVAGFNLSCLGDECDYSFVPSRCGSTRSDRVALHVLKHIAPAFKKYSFLDRGSDERQYCAPGVDLPIASVMRSKYGTFPEYHTSLDDLTFVTPDGLAGGFGAIRRCIEALECDRIYRIKVLCEPQMGRRGLYNTLGTKDADKATKIRMNILAYSDGRHSLMDIADLIGCPVWELAPYVVELVEHNLIGEVGPKVDPGNTQ